MLRNMLSTAGLLLTLMLVLSGSGVRAEDWPNWRGPKRDGISTEKGLLKQWPKDGPTKLWSLPGVGTGYASVTVADGMIYTTGGKDGQGVLFAIDLDGKIVWEKAYSREGGGGGYGGARSTPTVFDGKVYIISSLGVVCCHDAKSGEQIWTVDTREKYGADLPSWEIAESPLIFDGKVIATVGGSKATMVALDPKTGAEVWASQSLGVKSAYCSPLVVEQGKRQIILGMVESGLIGVDAKDGKILFQQAHKNKYAVHANTPIFKDGMIYITSGYNYGGEMIKLASGKASQAWFSKELAVHHGGVVLLDGCVIGASDREWVAIDLASGKTAWKNRLIGKGSLVVADGLIYGYGENGTVGLIKADKKGGEVLGQFRITEGEKEHWAHPVVSGGRLYIRHGTVLMAFDVKN